MQDAESRKPLVGDDYARKLLGEEGVSYWKEFKQFTRANASNLARHYLIDTLVKKVLTDQPGATIILIGAGLDSRAFRLKGGNWIEIDETAIIEYKNRILPVSECSNSLVRIPIDFEKEKLAYKLAPYAGRPDTMVIVEGVFMYLTNLQKHEMLSTLTTLFPRHSLICDLMSKKFFEKYGSEIHAKLSQYGAVFRDIAEEPAQIFLDHGYRKVSVFSMPKTASDLGLVRIPLLVRVLFFGKPIWGYSLYSFKFG